MGLKVWLFRPVCFLLTSLEISVQVFDWTKIRDMEMMFQQYDLDNMCLHNADFLGYKT